MSRNIFFRCSTCEKDFGTKSALNYHTIRVHERDNLIECTKCDKKFVDQYQLSRHFVTHSRIRKYKCEFCLRSYLRKRNLMRHIPHIHFPRRKVACPYCPKIYATKDSMLFHLNGKHPEHRGKDTPEDSFDVCNDEYVGQL